MKNKKTIAYWASTILLCFFLLGGIGQLFQVPQVVEGFAPLHYPLYFISIIGFWKVLAIPALLIPKRALLKEWTYAGIFFAMTGASISHIASKSETFHIIMPLIIVAVSLCSYFLRPESRKLQGQ